MDAKSALFHLELSAQPPVDVLEEVVEDRCFELRDYFLRNPVIPELYASRIKRLERLAEAAEALGLPVLAHPSTSKSSAAFEGASLDDILRGFEESHALLRKQMSATLHPLALAGIAQAMIEVQEQYEEAFFMATQRFGIQEEAVKASNHLDTGRLLRWMNLHGEPQPTQTGESAKMIEAERRRISDRRARAHRR
jgi:hypothetical protein